MTNFATRMREALRLTRSGNLRDATGVIKRALGKTSPSADGPIDVEFEVVDGAPAPEPRTSLLHRLFPETKRPPKPPGPRTEPRGGRTVAGAWSNSAGTRTYRLWIPEAEVQTRQAPRSLVVMLHGCTQDAGDFADGTRMNTIAGNEGCYVLYPEQASRANMHRCWNWFQPNDQLRDRGEPSIVAEMTREIVREHAIDPRRVFVAGLSAGAAMAVILGETYPDLFAAIGVHSGLPYGSAHDVASALAAMKGRARDHTPAPRSTPLPAIVFHGDRDKVVVPGNGTALVEQVRATWPALRIEETRGEVPDGHSYLRTRFHDGKGDVAIEHWLVQGAGHAWSGGDASGSFTDPKGPDASAAMLEFFLGRKY